jgi:hypothetical protein
VCKSLLAGFRQNIFRSGAALQGRKGDYVHLPQNQVGGKVEQMVGLMDRSSSLYRPMTKEQVGWVLVISLFAPPGSSGKVIMSLMGAVRPEWIPITYHIKRWLDVSADKASTVQNAGASLKCCTVSGGTVILQGPAANVVDQEESLRKKLMIEEQLKLEVGNQEQDQLNLETIMRMPQVFQQLIRFWGNEKQVEIDLDPTSKTFTVKARENELKQVKGALLFAFLAQLKQSAVVHMPAWPGPDGTLPKMKAKVELFGVPPTRPSEHSGNPGMFERLSRVTSSSRPATELFEYVHGKLATRETRMEVVAWIAVSHFGCRLEGGFLRDWIVTGSFKRPTSGAPSSWITRHGSVLGRPELDPNLLPADLDLQVPVRSSFGWFDLANFVAQVEKLGITVDFIHQDPFLRCIAFDADPKDDRFAPFMAGEVLAFLYASCRRVLKPSLHFFLPRLVVQTLSGPTLLPLTTRWIST